MSTERTIRLTGRTRVLAVFGCPVEHSLSPPMHNAAIAALGLDYVYVPFRVELDDLPKAFDGLRAMRFAGANLTIPLKQRALELVDGLTDNARRIGSVNTLYWDDGRLMGDSTDGEGFTRSLEVLRPARPERALVLGAGGSARAVCFALADAGVPVAIANRTRARAEELAAAVGPLADVMGLDEAGLRKASSEADLVVNCTSVGMIPEPDASPMPVGSLRPGQFVYDLVYQPRETLLLRQAAESGATAANGIKMLVWQGAASFQRWTGYWPDTSVMEKAID